MREYSQLTEQQRIALRGRAQLGEVTTTLVRLKESKQFKVSCFLNENKCNEKICINQLINSLHNNILFNYCSRIL